MRALFLCPTLTVGGAERQWAILLPSLQRLGFDVLVATLNTEGHFYDVLAATPGIETRSFAMRNRLDVVRAAKTAGLRRWKPDVVVSQSIDAHVVGRAVAVLGHAPQVAVEHAGPGLAGRRSHHRLAYRLVAPRVTRVVAVSAAQAPDLRRLGFRSERVRVIPNGIDVPEHSRDRAAVLGELGLAPETFLAVLVATLRAEKRAEFFIEAVARAHARDPRIRGVVVGAGPCLGQARHLAAGTGSTDVIGFREHVGDYVAAADVVALTSSVEAAPMSLLEAMALERPIVATDVGGVRDLVGDDAAILTAPDDIDAFTEALAALALEPGRAAALGANGRTAYQARFTTSGMVAAYADLLHELYDRGGRA